MKVLVFASVVFLVGCTVSSKRPEMSDANSTKTQPLVDPEYRLESDREAIKELRKGIPEEKQRSNDEAALLAELMGKVEKHPSDIRDKYNQMTRKKRDAFDKEMTKSREEYVKNERKKREEFLNGLQKERDAFSKSKHPREEQKEFYDNINQRRQEFFAAERENRGEFESDFRDKRKNFDDYMRERNQDFNEQHRAYYKAWEEKLKVDKMKKKMHEDELKKNDAQMPPE